MLDNIKLTISKTGFWFRKHSAELLVAGAIVSGAGAIVTAIISTKKLDKTLKPFNDKIDSIRKDLKDNNKIQNGEVIIKESKKELTTTYLKAGLKVFNLYLPSTILFATSCSCILGSHYIQKNRNLALAAMYSALEKSYNSYRNRVKEKYGEEKEEEIYKDIRPEEVEVTTSKGTKVMKKNIPHDTGSLYSVFYDCGCAGWEKNALQNFHWLMMKQAYFNDRLRRYGYVFLNEVYEELGIDISYLGKERARASHMLGWIYKPKDPTRDSYISFGITQPGTDVALPRIAEQIEANIPTFLLDFNVDGDILTGNNGKNIYTEVATQGV